MESVSSMTNVRDLIGELNGGSFEEKLALVLSEVALGTVVHGGKKKGKLTIEFTFHKIGDNDQLVLSHKLSKVTPTKRGDKSEVDTTETPFYVGKGGVMTINPPKEQADGQKNFELA